MQIVINTMKCPCRTLNDECGINNNECYEDDICSSCPLIMNGGVKLPKGHRRLVDANFALEAKITRSNNGVSDRTKGWNEACQAIFENAPTIIEVESEKL